MRNLIVTILMTAALLALSAAPLLSQEQDRNASLDRKVRAFLEARSGKWHDLNVPASDGKPAFRNISTRVSAMRTSWYRNYFDGVTPKLKVGGAYVSHNVSDRGWNSFGLGKYVDYIKGREDFETTFDDNGAGVSISYKKR